MLSIVAAVFFNICHDAIHQCTVVTRSIGMGCNPCGFHNGQDMFIFENVLLVQLCSSAIYVEAASGNVNTNSVPSARGARQSSIGSPSESSTLFAIRIRWTVFLPPCHCSLRSCSTVMTIFVAFYNEITSFNIIPSNTLFHHLPSNSLKNARMFSSGCAPSIRPTSLPSS